MDTAMIWALLGIVLLIGVLGFALCFSVANLGGTSAIAAIVVLIRPDWSAKSRSDQVEKSSVAVDSHRILHDKEHLYKTSKTH
jgi:lysylphosphatidylglycerol synthetase-like protein (DUF2156 family)